MIRRRVGISLLAFSPHTLAGQGTYTIGVTRALVSRQVHDYIVLLPLQHEGLWRELLPGGSSLVMCGPDPDERLRRVVFEHRHLPTISRRYGIDTLFFPHMLAPTWRLPRTVVTVYDLLLLSERTDFPWYKRLYHRWSYGRLTSRVSHIVTISEFCRRDIVARLGMPPERVSVVYPGLDPEFTDASLQGYGPHDDAPEPYLLSVAGAYPHKRLGILLKAFSTIAAERPNLHLVLAGTHTGRPEAISRLRAQANATGVASRIRFLPRLPREEVARLFVRAAAFVSSSEFEGFGIPIIEAMAVGCPVAASPAEAVLEASQGAMWVARDFSAEALTEALLHALSARHSSESSLRDAARRVRTKYSWDAAASVLESIFERAVTHRESHLVPLREALPVRNPLNH
jgi:glycosyltransferase involved in cell wall biosynthesis